MAYEDYWISRAEGRLDDQQEYVTASILEINQAYEEAMKELQRKIDRLFWRFVREGGMTEQEARAILKQTIFAQEISDIWEQLEKISDPEIRQQLLKQVDAYYYQSRISREEALQAAIRTQMSRVAEQELAIHTKAYTNVIRQEYLRSMFDAQQYLGVAFSFQELPEKIIRQILAENWSGKHYSRRIWGNAQTINREIEKLLLKGAMLGTNSRKLARQLSDLADSGTYAAERLIRTETTYFTTMADLEAAKARGTEQVRFVATLDMRTSPECRAADGSIINIEDAKPGKNVPPLHPFCRSVIIDVIKGLVHKVRRARNPATGKNYLVPADMTYKEWGKLPLAEKQINMGQVKGVTLQHPAEKTNLSREQINAIKKTIADVGKEYDVKLDYLEIGDYTDKEHIKSPMFFRALEEDGQYRSKLVINNACKLWNDSTERDKIFNFAFFAGRSIEDFTWHEMAHVLTFQKCRDMKEYLALEKTLRLRYVRGISEYADNCMDGAETIAEAIVKKRAGYAIPPQAEHLLEEWVEIWKKR